MSYDAFRRGVVVTLQEVISDDNNDNDNANATTTTTTTVIVANVHLPAHPSVFA